MFFLHCDKSSHECAVPDSWLIIAGDGKIGLLVAQVLACSGRCGSLTLIGRHDAKMHLVTGGTSCSVPASPEAVQGAAAPLVIEYVSASEEGAVAALAGIFDMTVEASGGISTHGFDMTIIMYMYLYMTASFFNFLGQVKG